MYLKDCILYPFERLDYPFIWHIWKQAHRHEIIFEHLNEFALHFVSYMLRFYYFLPFTNQPCRSIASNRLPFSFSAKWKKMRCSLCWFLRFSLSIKTCNNFYYLTIFWKPYFNIWDHRGITIRRKAALTLLASDNLSCIYLTGNDKMILHILISI